MKFKNLLDVYVKLMPKKEEIFHGWKIRYKANLKKLITKILKLYKNGNLMTGKPFLM